MENFNIEELRQKFEDLVNITKCPVYLDTVCIPLVQCVRGHIICAKCRESNGLDTCSTCKDHFTQVQPPIAFCQIVEVLPHGCEHGNCPKLMTVGSDHTLYCGFKPTTCKLCEWIGPGNNIAEHLKDKHIENVLTETEPNMIWENFEIEDYRQGYSLFSAYGHFIWEETINDPSTPWLCKKYYFIANGKPTNDFFIEVCFISSGPKFIIKIKLNIDPTNDQMQKNVIYVPKYMLPYFVMDGKLMFRSKITTT